MCFTVNIYAISIKNTVPIDYTTGIKEKRNERSKENEKYALYIHTVFCIVLYSINTNTRFTSAFH